MYFSKNWFIANSWIKANIDRAVEESETFGKEYKMEIIFKK